MRLILAPDSFKQSLPADAVAEAMADGVRAAMADREVQIDPCPIADGGEGTLDAIAVAANGRVLRSTVTGPLGDPVEARWAICDDGRLGVIEMAEAAGLTLVPTDKRDPTRTTTYGVGELIIAALDTGCDRLLIGIGGSGTCDGGVGMLQALGARCEDPRGMIQRPIAGGDLAGLVRIDVESLDHRIASGSVTIDVACDVTNPLHGPDGAAFVFALQKGATQEQVAGLDAGLRHLASLASGADAALPGSGAAGGIGFALQGVLGARLCSGAQLVLDAVGFDERVRDADLVITGEGRLDATTSRGKACAAVAAAAAKRGVPTIAVVGSVAGDINTQAMGFADIATICDGSVATEDAIHNGSRYVSARTAAVILRWLNRSDR